MNYEDVNGDQDKAGDEIPDKRKPDTDREEYRGSDRRRRRSQHSDHEHRVANEYSPNRRSGQDVQHGSHPPLPPATYPNGQPYVQNIYAQDRTAAGYPRSQGYEMRHAHRRSGEAAC